MSVLREKKKTRSTQDPLGLQLSLVSMDSLVSLEIHSTKIYSASVYNNRLRQSKNFNFSNGTSKKKAKLQLEKVNAQNKKSGVNAIKKPQLTFVRI